MKIKKIFPKHHHGSKKDEASKSNGRSIQGGSTTVTASADVEHNNELLLNQLTNSNSHQNNHEILNILSEDGYVSKSLLKESTSYDEQNSVSSAPTHMPSFTIRSEIPESIQQNPKTPYTSVQMKRLDELKKLREVYETYQGHPNNLHHTNPQQNDRIKNSNGVTSWEIKRYVTLEEWVMSFIQKSPYRMTLCTLGLLMTIQFILSLNIEKWILPMTTTTMNTIKWYSWANIGPSLFEIIVANIKLYIFIILYGFTLDIVLISAFDNIDMPMITLKGSSLKDVVIREYVIGKIREATANISMGISAAGVFYAITRILLNIILGVSTNIYSFVVGIMDALSLSNISESNDVMGMEMIVRSMEYIAMAPWNLIISPILQYSGISWLSRKLLSFVKGSAFASISISIGCSKSIIATTYMMLYIGVFLLVLYIFLVHIYPTKGGGGNKDTGSNMSDVKVRNSLLSDKVREEEKKESQKDEKKKDD